MTGTDTDLTIALFVRDAGALLHASVIAADRAAEYARAQGLQVQRLLVTYEPDARTEGWIAEFVRSPWVVVASHGDGLGRARNTAVAAMTGDYLVMLDAPDLCSETFPAEAWALAEAAGYEAVWHPESAVRFGNHYYFVHQREIVFHPDPPVDGFDYANLLMGNPYSSLSLASRSVLETVPFPIEDPARGWTDIDGWWVCDTAGEGIHHRTVPETAHYVRVVSAPGAAAVGRMGPTRLARGQLPPPLALDVDKAAVAGAS